MIALKIYLWLCAAIFLVVAGWGLYEDFIQRKADSKFGYNFQWPIWKSMFFWILLFASCPVINVLIALQLLYNRITEGPPPIGSPAWHDLQKRKA